MLNKRILVLIFLLVFLPLVGCFPSPAPPITENQAPTVTSIPITAVTVGETYVYNVKATDPDGDTLTYSLTVKPTGMVIDPATGLIKWTPKVKGNYAVVVKVSDGVLDITQSFTIVVSKPSAPPLVNHAPIITPIPNLATVVGIQYTYTIEATDQDGDILTYFLTTNPSGMAIDPSTGVISWIPTAEGDYAVEVKVSDGKKSDTQNFTITVKTVEIIGIVVLPETMTLVTGGSETIQSVTAHYAIKSDFEVPIPLGDCTYVSDPIGVVTVSDVGLVTAIAEGKTTITVGYAGEGDTIEVTVVLPVHNIIQDLYYNTIQSAIDDKEVEPGDIIEVAAGTYNENINIDKSLTIVSVEGQEVTIINAQGALIAVLINGAETTATFDGFTVKNYETIGILAGAFAVTWGDDPYEVHILNNIVEEPGAEDKHNNCIQVGDGTTGTVIGNEVFGAWLVSPKYSGSGILVAGSSNVLVSENYVYDCEGGIQICGYDYKPALAEDNLIENNLIEDCKAGISVQGDSIGTIIRYNDMFNNDTGIGSLAYDYPWQQSTPSGTEIHYNNIVGNINYGVKSSVWFYQGTGNVLAEEVDATKNWWGSEFGPKHDGWPADGGDAVSDNVDYEHFLTSPH